MFGDKIKYSIDLIGGDCKRIGGDKDFREQDLIIEIMHILEDFKRTDSVVACFVVRANSDPEVKGVIV